MKAVSGLVLMVLTASCHSKTEQFVGRWVADDKQIADTLTIWHQADETYFRIGSAGSTKRYPADYNFWSQELACHSTEPSGCFEVEVTRKFKYLPQKRKLAMSTEYDGHKDAPEWQMYSKQQ